MGPQPRKSSITDCAGMIKYLPALPNTRKKTLLGRCKSQVENLWFFMQKVFSITAAKAQIIQISKLEVKHFKIIVINIFKKMEKIAENKT